MRVSGEEVNTGGEVSNQHPNLLTFVALASEVQTPPSARFRQGVLTASHTSRRPRTFLGQFHPEMA
jgi:hypothetical protein